MTTANALSRGERANSGRNRILGIEAGRGIAAVLVILYHVSRHIDATYKTPLLRQVFQFGHAGVDFFFVISGFIILYVHYQDIGVRDRLPRYAGRRFSRLMPTYWVAFVLSIGMVVAGRHALPSFADLTWQTFLLPSSEPMVLGVAWSLRFEILFYVMFAVLIIHRRLGLLLLASWFGLAAICSVTGAWPGELADQFRSAYVIEFLFGMAVAWLARNRAIRAPQAILALGLVLFALSCGLEDARLIDGYAAPARLAYGIPSALVILGIVAVAERSAADVPPLLRTLGKASYSLYLFQFLFIGTAWQILLKSHLAAVVPPLVQYGLLVLAAIVGGVIASKAIEQPLIRMFRSGLALLSAKQPA